mgnify:CR=1 FL=1
MRLKDKLAIFFIGFLIFIIWFSVQAAEYGTVTVIVILAVIGLFFFLPAVLSDKYSKMKAERNYFKSQNAMKDNEIYKLKRKKKKRKKKNKR